MSAATAAVVDRPRARGIVGLTVQLTAARFHARQGELLLYLAGVLAYTVVSALALTVAGGTWMFWHRYSHPSGIHAQLVQEDSAFNSVLGFYVALAVIACALLIPATVNLASGAALLGARGRERRLAALRLLGLTGGDVVRMSLIDALIQLVSGAVLGTLVHYLTLPLWGHLTMQAVPIDPRMMMLPGWLVAAVLVGVALVGLLATARGLAQVRISPLGVARKANKPALSWLRGLIFVVVVLASLIVIIAVPPQSDIRPYFVTGGVLVMVMVATNLVAPWILQKEALSVAKLPWPALKWASRRIVADPGATWRRVSGMALLAFIGGYVALMPLEIDSDQGSEAAVTFAEGSQLDFTKGAIITLAVGFVLTATSMLITQASGTIERAEQSKALRRMGAPASFSLKVMWLETFGPLVLGVLLGAGMGTVMALPMMQLASKFGFTPTSGVLLMGAVLVVGLVLGAASLLASHPLYFHLLRREQRRND